MFKTITLLNCLLAFSTFGYSQSLSPTVFASAGGSDVTNSIRLDWTLGELFTETSTIPTGLYTQGFHQPTLTIKSPSRFAAFLFTGYSVNIYPNPVASIVNVVIKSPTESKLSLSLTDSRGQLVYSYSTYSKGSPLKMDMSRFASGVYILTLVNSSGNTIGTYKIVKAA